MRKLDSYNFAGLVRLPIQRDLISSHYSKDLGTERWQPGGHLFCPRHTVENEEKTQDGPCQPDSLRGWA